MPRSQVPRDAAQLPVPQSPRASTPHARTACRSSEREFAVPRTPLDRSLAGLRRSLSCTVPATWVKSHSRHLRPPLRSRAHTRPLYTGGSCTYVLLYS